jgi:2,3,4,5-tetrahydropyridine-2-carboxylate N-succinyltransferase
MPAHTDYDFTKQWMFDEFVGQMKGRDDFVQPRAFALGVATMVEDFRVEGGARLLEAKFPWGVNFDTSTGTAAVMTKVLGALRDGHHALSDLEISRALDHFRWIGDEPGHLNFEALKALRGVDTKEQFLGHYRQPILACVTDLDAPPVSAGDVYLRLHLLSLRYVQPHGVNLDGAFGLLSNNCWTSHGVYAADRMDEVHRGIVAHGHEPLHVSHTDKFPRLVDYVNPSGVRIADGNRVRLGAHLAEGTTVMHEGFVNFNAGTLGKCMVEGRISAGVVVGAHSDIGGGASIMGTLSGGNKVVVSIGEGCLIGANAGLGVPLGDRVYVAAGHYLVGTSRVRITGGRGPWGDNSVVNSACDRISTMQVNGDLFVKAGNLADISDAVFRRNDIDGVNEVVPRGDTNWGSLNDMLHDNN